MAYVMSVQTNLIQRLNYRQIMDAFLVSIVESGKPLSNNYLKQGEKRGIKYTIYLCGFVIAKYLLEFLNM